VNHNLPDIGVFANPLDVPQSPKDSDKLNLKLLLANVGPVPSQPLVLSTYNKPPEEATEADKVLSDVTLEPFDSQKSSRVELPLTFQAASTGRLYFVARGGEDFDPTYNVNVLTFAAPGQESPLAGIDEPVAAATPTPMAPGKLGTLSLTIYVRRGVVAANTDVEVYRAGDRKDAISLSHDNPAVFPLPAGTYDVKARYETPLGRLYQWVTGLAVREGETTEGSVSFGTGTLMVTSRKEGIVQDEDFYLVVYPAGEREKYVLDTNDNPAILTLPAGTYDLQVSYYAGREQWIERVIVEEGKRTEQVVDYFAFSPTPVPTPDIGRGNLVITVYASEGVEAYRGLKLEIEVYLAGDHTKYLEWEQRRPSLFSLPPGTYDVHVTLGRLDKWLNGLVVERGKTTEASVTFNFGRLIISVYEAEGVEAESVHVEVYPAGEHAEYLDWEPGTHSRFSLPAGTYDVRVELRSEERYGEERWLEGLVVEAGKTADVSVTFGP
jgi:hypothetical protein